MTLEALDHEDSTRLLHEYLAGKIVVRDQFERPAFGEGNDFTRWMERATQY